MSQHSTATEQELNELKHKFKTLENRLGRDKVLAALSGDQAEVLFPLVLPYTTQPITDADRVPSGSPPEVPLPTQPHTLCITFSEPNTTYAGIVGVGLMLSGVGIVALAQLGFAPPLFSLVAVIVMVGGSSFLAKYVAHNRSRSSFWAFLERIRSAMAYEGAPQKQGTITRN